MTSSLEFSQRLGRLGTETAYAVSDEARALQATGATVYPYHIGDLNFSTPAIFTEHLTKAISENKTGYCPAAGIQPLRQSLAEGIGRARGVTYTADNVSVQSGGKPVIIKFLMAVMNEGDEVLYPTPGYPIYESVIRFLGGVPIPYEYEETDRGFKLRVDQLSGLMTPKTRILIYNNLQNPLGVSSSLEEMQEVAHFAVSNDLWVLSDEAYFDIVFEGEQRSIVSLPGMKDRTCILFTFSKSWSMTGWRLGAAIGPTTLITHINKLNTNDEACTTHFVQWAGIAWQTPEAKQFIKDLVAELKTRRDLLVPLINKVPGFKCSAPPATFYLFVNVTHAMRIVNTPTVEAFRKLILQETGVAVCHREHFGSALSHEVQQYVRFAYSGISLDQIRESMAKLKSFMEKQVAGQ